MIKVDQATIDRMEQAYAGIATQIQQFDAAKLPSCLHCGFSDTANVQVGVIQRTINICAATTKFRLIPNGPEPRAFYCRAITNSGFKRVVPARS